MVSVIIPVYNVEKYLARCLNSVLGQTYRNIEVICVNDGSVDGSQQILDEYDAEDSRVRLFYKENEGIADAVEHFGGKLMFAVDIDQLKEGKDFYGYKTHQPSYLKDHMDDFDHLLIGHYSRLEEIRSQALEVGVPDEKIVRPYEV